MGQIAATLRESHCRCQCESGPCAPEQQFSLHTYQDMRDHDRAHISNILKNHHNQSKYCNVPCACMEEGLVRAGDGLHLETHSLQSLADVDGDGVEFLEVVRAVFMMQPGHESLAPDHGGGELLYPEVAKEDVGQSAVEVHLRSDMKILAERLEKLHHKVSHHHSDLQTESGRDTAMYIQEEAACLAKKAADIALEASSEADRQGSLQKQLSGLVTAAEVLAKEIDSQNLHSHDKAHDDGKEFFLGTVKGRGEGSQAKPHAVKTRAEEAQAKPDPARRSGLFDCASPCSRQCSNACSNQDNDEGSVQVQRERQGSLQFVDFDDPLVTVVNHSSLAAKPSSRPKGRGKGH